MSGETSKEDVHEDHSQKRKLKGGEYHTQISVQPLKSTGSKKISGQEVSRMTESSHLKKSSLGGSKNQRLPRENTQSPR